MPSIRFFKLAALPTALLGVATFSAVPAGAQSGTARQFDGVYNGTNQVISDSLDSCPQNGPVTVAVRDGQFHLSWLPQQDFVVKIDADGRFYGRGGSLTTRSDKHMAIVPVVEGQVSGNKLVVDYGTRWCHNRLEATRS